MKNMELTKALILCFIIITFVLIINQLSGRGYYGNMSGDYGFHYYKTTGKIFYGFSEQNVSEYPPFVSWVSLPFAYREKVFYSFWVCFLGLIIPLVLFWLVRKWVVVLFYFSSGFFWWMEQGTFPHAVISLMGLCFWFDKRFWVRLFLLLGSLLVHSWGFVFLCFVWFVDLFHVLLVQKEFFVSGFMVDVREWLARNNSSDGGGHVFVFSWTQLLWFLLFQFNFCFFVYVFYKFFFKDFGLFLLCVGLFFVGVVFSPRVWFCLVLFLVFGLGRFFGGSGFWVRLGLFNLGLFLFFFNVFFWLGNIKGFLPVFSFFDFIGNVLA